MSTSNTASDRHQLSFASRKMAPSQSSMSFKWPRRSKDEARKLEKERERVLRSKDWSKASPDALMVLDAEVLNGLPVEILEKLPADGLKRLSTDVLTTLSPETLSRLLPEDMRRLPLETLVTLPPKALAALARPAPGILSKLNAEQLGMVLPELNNEDLRTVPLEALSKLSSIDPRHLAQISEQGLGTLARRYPELYDRFQLLHHNQFLRLPHYILDKVSFERFQKIPWAVWAEQPEEVMLNLPPDVKKALPPEVWARPSVQSEAIPAVSSMETQLRASSPITPSFPVEVSQDGILIPKAASSMSPPAIPPRTNKPPLSYNNHANSPVKRNNSFSAPRSQTSQDFRTPAIRYLEGGLGAPDRRGSRSTNDGGDMRENLAYRPMPPTPDDISRKEVPDAHRVIEELNRDLAAKNRKVEELEAQIKEKESWWKQRVNDERESQSDKIVNLTVRMKSSADRIFSTLAAMAPDKRWDLTDPDPTALMIGFLKDVDSRRQSWANRIFDCLEGLAPEMSWDRTHPDPVEMIIKYLNEVHSNAKENFNLATQYRMALQSEESKNDYLDRQLETATKQARDATDELATVKFNLEEREGQLKSADTRERNLGMQMSQLKHERDGYSKQARDLEKQIVTERAAAQTNLINQQTHYETQTQGIKQQNIELQAKVNEQHERWAQELKTQHDYYEGIRKKQEAMIETLTRNSQEALQQAEKQRKEELKAQVLHFSQELQKSRSHYDEKLERERQAHEVILKNHSVNLQKKIESLESDLVDNSDDFRPATDDSLKTRYGSLKLLVETITEPFNLGTVTIPQDGRFDPDNFLVREGKGQTRVLLRSKVWTKLMDGFFSSPFGFGSFGSTQGKLLLLELYSAWRKLFGDGPLPVSGFHVPDEIFELFRTEKEANKWRSATFQSILMAVSPRGQKKNQAANGHLVKPFADNRQKVHDDILDVLNHVCNDGVSPEIAENIVKIVQLAGELALEFGSQRAELALDTPGKGESITIGPEFVDCEDGESERGSTKEVDLLVLPKLFRVGDGRNDLKTRKIIVPGEIYPRRS